ncbi:MAG: TIGR02281 family clan AA aspartic protease [Rickettsiales bacterium]|nr:TIGR02281 family clan AA aspartic protease [Rickettsiales bacterium]
MNFISTPQLVYYIIILVFLILGIITRREISFFQILKYLFIWCAIAFVVIAFYSFRYDFSDLKNRIIGEINPSQARLNDNGQIVINMSEDGHFYINLKINQKTIRFMVDTGASDVMLNANDAENIGIDVNRLTFNRPYQTANGISFGASIILEEIEIAGVRFINIPASVSNANMGVSLLGMSFLKRCKKYEFYQDKLILTFGV